MNNERELFKRWFGWDPCPMAYEIVLKSTEDKYPIARLLSFSPLDAFWLNKDYIRDFHMNDDEFNKVEILHKGVYGLEKNGSPFNYYIAFEYNIPPPTPPRMGAIYEGEGMMLLRDKFEATKYELEQLRKKKEILEMELEKQKILKEIKEIKQECQEKNNGI